MEALLHVGLSNAVIATLLALVAACASLSCRRPAVIHGLWLLVLLKLITPPLVWVPVPAPQFTTGKAEAEQMPSTELNENELLVAATFAQIAEPGEHSGSLRPRLAAAPMGQGNEARESVAADEAGSKSAPIASVSWQVIFVAVWLAGTAAWFTLAIWRIVTFHRLLRHARLAPARIQIIAGQLAQDMGLRRSPAVLLTPGRLPPMLWALGRAQLLLPETLLPSMTPQQLQAMLAHELAHLGRRDHWTRVLEFATLGLYWWLPIAWYARRALREAEEQCCDAWVVSTLPGAGKAYAHALLETLDFLSTSPAAVPVLASGIGQVSDLKRRLRMIMSGTTPRSLTWRGTAALLGMGLFLLPMLPTLVQGEFAPEDERQPPPPRDRGRDGGPPGRGPGGPDGRGGPRPVDVKATPEQSAELKKLQEEVNKKANELAEASKKLREAARKAAGDQARGPVVRFEGLPPVIVRGPRDGEETRNLMLHRTEEGWVVMPGGPPGRPGGGPPGFDGRRGPGGGRDDDGPPGRGGRRFDRRGPGDDDRPPPPPRGGREGGRDGDRVEQLERRLESVMRQLEELRREMRPRRGPGGPPGGGPPPDRKPPE